MKSKSVVLLVLLMSAITAQAQIIDKRQVNIKGQNLTLVMYTYKCFVEKGEGVKVKIYDGGGTELMTVCRTGGGTEPAFLTFPDGSSIPSSF